MILGLLILTFCSFMIGEFSWLSLWQVCVAYLVAWPNLLSWVIWTLNTLHSLGLLYVCAHGHSEAREHLETPSGLWWFNILVRRVDCPCHYGASLFRLLASGHNESRWPWSRLYFVVQNEPWCCLLIRVCPFLGPISLTLHSPRITGAESTRSPGGSLEERVRLPLFFKKKYLFIWLCQVLVVAHGIFHLHCGMWDLFWFFRCGIWYLFILLHIDLVLWPGVEPRGVLTTGPPGKSQASTLSFPNPCIPSIGETVSDRDL